MIDVSFASYVAIAAITIFFLESCFHLKARFLQAFIRYLPLARIEHFFTKFKEIALLYFSTTTNYDTIGWFSFFLLVPTVMKWSCYCLGISQFEGRHVQVQPGQQGQQNGFTNGDKKENGEPVEEIELDFEKNQPYVVAALRRFKDLSDEDLLHALKYLQSQGLFWKRNAMDLFHAIEHLKVNGHVVLEAASGSLEPTFQQQHSREELVDVLVSSKRYERRDIEDVMNRYQEQFGHTPTMEQFVEFHDGLRGIADLEAKLEEKDRKIATTIEEKNRKDKTIEDKDRTIEDNHRTIEDKDRTIEDNHRTIEDKDRTIEDNHRTIRDLELKVTRSLCKLCMNEEVSVVCLPCGHLYCCNRGQCMSQLTTRGKCHMCGQIIVNQIQTILS